MFKEITVVSVERTGKEKYIASSEYKVTLSNGNFFILWSPPWHDFTKEEEDKGAWKEARKQCKLINKRNKSILN